jgi:hypothetical protein
MYCHFDRIIMRCRRIKSDRRAWGHPGGAYTDRMSYIRGQSRRRLRPLSVNGLTFGIAHSPADQCHDDRQRRCKSKSGHSSGERVHPRGGWHFRDPCLLTDEAERLVSWLEAVANGKPLPAMCDLTEPTLEFRAIPRGQRGILQVHFRLRSRPDWALSSAAERQELRVDFLVTI